VTRWPISWRRVGDRKVATTWEYLQSDADSADLAALGAAGWELVTLWGNTWILKRPVPEPAERFTLEQRAVALGLSGGNGATPAGPHPSPAPLRLLNPDVAALIRRVNHTQMLLIADRGFPIPKLPHVVDLSLTADIPTVPQVLAAILPDLPVDRFIVAEEQREAAPTRWQEHHESGMPVEALPHLQFKAYSRLAVGCIRTGDSTPYGNLIIVGG
jgi:D-ribose pyranase